LEFLVRRFSGSQMTDRETPGRPHISAQEGEEEEEEEEERIRRRG
jgi:hypothetical protein